MRLCPSGTTSLGNSNLIKGECDNKDALSFFDNYFDYNVNIANE